MATEAEIRQAAEILLAGGLVVFPTETVYGLGANALDADAVAKVYRAKGRPSTSPLIVHVVDEMAARECCSDWPALASRLAERFWPGPLTIILPKAKHIPDAVTAGLGTVGLRVPSHPVAQRLLEQVGVPIAAPSANRFMSLSPTLAAHVRRSLAHAAELVLEGGPSAVGLESTVISLVEDQAEVVRPGGISAEELTEAIGAPIRQAPMPLPGAAHISPGQHVRHYSPQTLLRVLAAEEPLPVEPAVWIWSQQQRAGIPGIQLPADPAGFARGLYHALHEADAMRVALIAVEAPPRDPAWLAIWDRLLRAQG
jgi:L-threonylcarbamoyladenylate synthase